MRHRVHRRPAGRLTRVLAALVLLCCAIAVAAPALSPRHPAAAATAAGRGPHVTAAAGPRGTAAPAPAPARAAVRTAVPTAARPSAPGGASALPVLRVRLRGGDTLWGLARRYGTTVAALQRLNRLGTSTMIYAGAVLEVPGGPGKPLSAATAEDVSVTRTASRVTETSSSHGSLRQLAAEVFGAQYPCAAAIITRESGWQVHALNPSSGAYGLAQALPGSKMAAAGPAWRDDPATQLRWMRSYVDSSYGGACAAWSFWQAHSWY